MYVVLGPILLEQNSEIPNDSVEIQLLNVSYRFTNACKMTSLSLAILYKLIKSEIQTAWPWNEGLKNFVDLQTHAKRTLLNTAVITQLFFFQVWPWKWRLTIYLTFDVIILPIDRQTHENSTKNSKILKSYLEFTDQGLWRFRWKLVGEPPKHTCVSLKYWRFEVQPFISKWHFVSDERTCIRNVRLHSAIQFRWNGVTVVHKHH